MSSNPQVAGDIDPEAIDWLWRERIPRGMITVVAGRPDQGKGLFACHIAAEVSAAGENVVYSAAEDSASLMTRPRLEAASADLKRVFLPENPIMLPGQIEEMRQLIIRNDIALWIVDPLNAHLKGVSRHSDNIREALGPVKKVLQETGCTLLIIEHALKGSRKSGHPLDMIGGQGSGLPAAARAAYIFGRDPDDPDRRVLAPAKFNIGPFPDAFAFEIDVAEQDTGDYPLLVPDEELQAFDAMRLFQPQAKTGTATQVGRPRDKRAAAAEWLTTYLADAGGPVKASTIQEDAKQYKMSQKTLRRAADDMGIVKSAKGGPNVTWDLPEDVKELMGLLDDEDATSERSDHDVALDEAEATEISLDEGLAALLGNPADAVGDDDDQTDETEETE